MATAASCTSRPLAFYSIALYSVCMTTTTQHLTGYICKTCHGPSPLGIGYTDDTPGAYQRSAEIQRCACGTSCTLDQLALTYLSDAALAAEYALLAPWVQAMNGCPAHLTERAARLAEEITRRQNAG